MSESSPSPPALAPADSPMQIDASGESRPAATSSKRAAPEEQLDEDRMKKKPRTQTSSASRSMRASVTPALVRFFHGDLKRHLVHFMTRHDVTQLGRSSKHLTAEAMQMDDWPLAVSTITAHGVRDLRTQLQDAQLRQLKQLHWVFRVGDLKRLSSLEELRFPRLKSLHLNFSRLQIGEAQFLRAIVQAVEHSSLQHTLEHLFFDRFEGDSWIQLLQTPFPQLQTLHLQLITCHYKAKEARLHVAGILRLKEDFFPKLREIRISWKPPTSMRKVRLYQRKFVPTHVTAIHDKFRTWARAKAGVRFRCVSRVEE